MNQAAEAPVVTEAVDEEQDQNANINNNDDNPIPANMGMDDPRRNRLTPEEFEFGKQLKDAVEMMPDLENMTDFMYAQYGVVVKNDIDNAIRRALGVQEFKKEYKILDTYEEGCRCLEKLFELMPGQHLGFSFSQQEGTYVFAHDAPKLDSTRLNTPEKVDDWLRGGYYIHTAFCPDMDSIRKGIICLAECEGWDWTKKQDLKTFQKFFSELLTVYPFNGQLRLFHTSTTVNIMATLLRQILPTHLRSTFKTGLTFEGRLDEFFLVPDAKTANQRMLARLKATLKRRYDHEKSFSLKGNC